VIILNHQINDDNNINKFDCSKKSYLYSVIDIVA